jgi:hypothetical protein
MPYILQYKSATQQLMTRDNVAGTKIFFQHLIKVHSALLVPAPGSPLVWLISGMQILI